MMGVLSGFALAACLFASPAMSQSDSTNSESDADLRIPRKWAISAEVGMNSLSSLAGPVATFYAQPQIALDLGLGMSLVGPRPGFRARYLFSRESLAYFAGFGLKRGLGRGDEEIELEDPDTEDKINLRLESAIYLDLMVGAELLARNGFLLIVTTGYSNLLAMFYQLPADTGYSRDSITGSKLGSGIMLSLSLGQAF